MSSDTSQHKPFKTTVAIVLGIIIGILSGVGATHLYVIGDVRKHDIQIANTEKEIGELAVSFENRMNSVIKLWEAQLNTERELILLVREQNRLLERTR